ncbi:glycosyltransferase [Runella sp.]|uniref:glycosyltransferase n=1 Tax=Runella sp. TaxID=1960881 RepID=UPI003D0F44A2
MGVREPKITVLMPAYNAGKYIYEAIRSVLDQTFTDFELLVVNDGSTDDTLSVINAFNDARIIILNQENKGIAAALNHGLKHARAPYIARFDADDICYPDRLEVQYNFILAHPDYEIIGSAADYVDVAGNYVFTNRPVAFSDDEINRLHYKICPFIHSTVFYRKKTITDFDGYNEHAYTYEDHFLWAQIPDNVKVCNLDRSLIKVRLNPESITIDEKWRTYTFRKIKYRTLKNRSISEHDGRRLLEIGRKQHSSGIKEGAYYALLGKKYLWNNYQPAKARENLLKTLSISPFHIKNYFLLLLSFLPEKGLVGFYNAFKMKYEQNQAALSDAEVKRKEFNYGN